MLASCIERQLQTHLIESSSFCMNLCSRPVVLPRTGQPAAMDKALLTAAFGLTLGHLATQRRKQAKAKASNSSSDATAPVPEHGNVVTVVPAPPPKPVATEPAAAVPGGPGAPGKPEVKIRPPESKAVKPFLPGETTILVPHMYDKDAPKLEIRVSNDDLQYSLRPKYITRTREFKDVSGDSAKEEKEQAQPIIYLDPEDAGFFERKIENPVLTCWILIKNTRWTGGGYCKRRLAEEMRRRNIICKLVHPMKCDLLVSKDGLQNVVYAGEPTELPDCVIPRVGAVVDYFGLAIMRQLETLGVLMFNPTPSIEISRDKLYTHQVLATNSVPIPKTVLGRRPLEYPFIQKHFGYPVIVKNTSGSKGEAVWKCDSEDELRELMKKLELGPTPIIFQEFLEATKGRDLRCVVVGKKLVASMMRIAKSGFKANVHQGGTVKPIKVGKQLEDMVVKTSQLCQLDFSGVDLLLDKPGYKVCEVNSSPGFEGLERATGVDIAAAMVSYVKEQVLQRRAAGGRRKLGDTENVPLQEDHLLALKTPTLAPQRRELTSVPAFSVSANAAAAVGASPSIRGQPQKGSSADDSKQAASQRT